MSDYCIRLYRNSDYDAARDLFVQGLMEHARGAFSHALSLPHIWLIMLFVFLCPLFTIGSIALSFLALTLALILLWFCTRDLYSFYIQHCLSDDMKDIDKYYLQKDGHCFWVAESAGQVVGIVAAVPSPNPGGEKHVELKRLSVADSQRGKGIGKALCRTLIDFARKRGSEAVVLDTTLAQTDAQRLYEKMGFKFPAVQTNPVKILPPAVDKCWVRWKYWSSATELRGVGVQIPVDNYVVELARYVR